MARYIDAELLEKEIRNYADKKCFNGETELANGILKTLSILKEQPKADVKKVVHGKWKEKDTESELLAICSNCKYPISWWHKSNFCPNCGANMREENNE